MSKESILEGLEKDHYRLYFTLSIFLILGNIFILNIVPNDTPICSFDFELCQKEYKKILITILKSIVAIGFSVVAALTYNFLQETEYKKKLVRLTKIAPIGLLESLFETLRKHNNLYVIDQNISVKFRKIQGNDKYYRCEVTYEYKKKLNHNKMKFHLNRTGATNKHLDYLSYEYYYALDETSLSDIANKDDIKKQYSINNIIIDDVRYNHDSDDDLEFDLYFEQKKEGIHRIEYDVSFPIEKSSFLYFTIELPTQGFFFNYDYSDIKDEIEMNGQHLLTSNSNPIVINKKSVSNISFRHRDEWILPKSTVALVWWEKESEK